MPLDNFITRPDFSRQIKQYASTIATLSGQTNILEKFSVKSIEIDTAGANDGDALIFNSATNKFSPNTPGTLGSRVIAGLILTYNSGLTYNVSEGTYRINSVLYGYTGGTIDIISGLTSGSRFDVVFITSASTALVTAGTTSINPTIPQINISGGELPVGIIFIPASFTGGTGTSIIQSTGSTFEFNSSSASAGIQRQGGVGAVASGDYSFASNFEAKASGNYSSAIGYYAEATGVSQTVVGQYNTPDEGFFIVGNGTAPGSRSNAFRVTTGGSVFISDNLKVTNNISGSALYLYDSPNSNYGLILADNYWQFFDSSNNKLLELSKDQGLILLDTISATTARLYSSGNSASRSYMLPNKDGTIALLSDLTGATGGSGSTSGTSLGDGVKVLFSSDTTSLSFATLSSQTPSSLRIISSSTGVILFSATTGSGPVTGNFVPLTGTTYTSPMQGDLVFTGDVSTQVFNGIKTYYDDGGSNTGYTFVNGAGITFGTTDGTIVRDLSIGVSFANDVSTTLAILDTATGSGNIVTVPEITGQANKLIKVKSDETGFDFFEGYQYMDLATAQGGGPFTIGQWYRIPVSSRTVTESANPNSYGDILLMAVDNNKLSIDGYLLAINADYQDVGDYTDADAIVGSTAGRRKGVPYYGQNFTQRDVTIFNNIHWLCTADFSNTRLLSELQDTNYFTALTKDYTSAYGYIIEADKITYDITNDRILSRIDKRGNIIHENSSNIILDKFRFGDDNVTNNFIKASNVQNFDVLNIPKDYFLFKENTLTSFNKIFLDSSTDFVSTDTKSPINISGVSVNDAKFEVLNRVTAYNGSINNYKSTIEETLTLTSSTINLTYRYLTGKITLLSGAGFNRVVTAITQIANTLYNVNTTFNSQNVSGITFVNNKSAGIMTEGGLNAFISGNTWDNIEFDMPYGETFYRQININNYIE